MIDFDIVIPNGNEKELLKEAKKLGVKIYFLYEKKSKETVKPYILVNKKDKDSKFLFCTPERKNFENKKTDFIYGFETLEKKEHYHYRKSGLDQVLCKLAKEKDITIVFDFSKLYSKNKEQVLGRMMQNARLCKKYGVKTVVFSFAKNPKRIQNPSDLDAFSRVIGLEKYKY